MSNTKVVHNSGKMCTMRLIIALIVSQILLLGLLSTQEAEKSTVALLPLPVLSIWFHYVCKGNFNQCL
jgi:K+ transporter